MSRLRRASTSHELPSHCVDPCCSAGARRRRLRPRRSAGARRGRCGRRGRAARTSCLVAVRPGRGGGGWPPGVAAGRGRERPQLARVTAAGGQRPDMGRRAGGRHGSAGHRWPAPGALLRGAGSVTPSLSLRARSRWVRGQFSRPRSCAVVWCSSVLFRLCPILEALQCIGRAPILSQSHGDMAGSKTLSSMSRMRILS